MKRVFLFLGIAVCAPAFGNVVADATGTLSKLDVNAQATLTFGTNTLTITIENLAVDQTSDIQSVNGLTFTLSGFTFTNVTDTSFSSTDWSDIQKNVVNGWTATPDTTNNWLLSTSSSTFSMTTIGNPQAPYTIIGSPNSNNEFTNVNGSITNDTHDPFLAETATWVFNVPGLLPSDQYDVSNVEFGFGTSNAYVLGDALVVTPEPGSLALAACGLAAVALGAFRPRRSSNASKR